MFLNGKIYNGELWTSDEDKNLRSMAKAGKTFTEIVDAFPERTKNAVFLHARDISSLNTGKQGDDVLTNRSETWTADDDKKLIRLFAEPGSYYELGKKLGRTTNAITSRLCALCKDRKYGVTYSNMFEKIRFFIYAKKV